MLPDSKKLRKRIDAMQARVDHANALLEKLEAREQRPSPPRSNHWTISENLVRLQSVMIEMHQLIVQPPDHEGSPNFPLAVDAAHAYGALSELHCNLVKEVYGSASDVEDEPFEDE